MLLIRTAEERLKYLIGTLCFEREILAHQLQEAQNALSNKEPPEKSNDADKNS